VFQVLKKNSPEAIIRNQERTLKKQANDFVQEVFKKMEAKVLCSVWHENINYIATKNRNSPVFTDNSANLLLSLQDCLDRLR